MLRFQTSKELSKNLKLIFENYYNESLKNKVNGVYVFTFDKTEKMYLANSINLDERIKSYFNKNIISSHTRNINFAITITSLINISLEIYIIEERHSISKINRAI